MMPIHYIFSMITHPKLRMKKPIVPSIMLTGMITTAVTKYLPGPGSHITRKDLTFVKHVHHYETLQIHFEVVAVSEEEHTIDMLVSAHDEKRRNCCERFINSNATF